MGGSAVKFKIASAEKTRCCNLENCGLRSIPDQLHGLAEYLSSLDLSRNKIDDLTELKRFLKLRYINASHNRLMQIPDIEFVHLHKLQSFILNDNVLYYLPPVFANMSSLIEVNLANNRFHLFPVELCLLPKLEILDISNNTITKLPKLINKIQVIEMNLNKNKLTDLSSDQLAKCSRLRVLRIEDNDLSVDNFLPNFLEKSKVSFLTYSGNNFEETELCKLPGYYDYHGRYLSAKESLFAVENAEMKNTEAENKEEAEKTKMEKPEIATSLRTQLFNPCYRAIAPRPVINKPKPIPTPSPFPRSNLRQLLVIK